MSIQVGMVSLGCSKNQVDGELLLALMQRGGYTICNNPQECDVIVINTCGFIEAAKRESIETILEFCAQKKQGRLKAVAVTGCLAERYREEVAKEIPEVDVVLGIGCNEGIVDAIERALHGEQVHAFADKEQLSMEGDRVLANDPHFAYLKVGDGCDNCCAYCAIPLIRGHFRSRPIERVVEEARKLVRGGVREINVVAQDTTRYGEDLYGKLMLPELLRQLCAIEALEWVRVLYCYPDRVTEELLDVMAAEPKIVKYMDLPLQHVSGKILARMNRRGDLLSLSSLVNRIREKIPNVILRTTMIVGLPGETPAAFEELCTFVKQTHFERLGCFTYSPEEDTPAAEMEGQVDEEDKTRRAELLMDLQYGVLQDFNASCVGRRLQVLIEGREGRRWRGRSYMDAPDIDTCVYFTAEHPCGIGTFTEVEITGTHGYDLEGRAVKRA